MPDFRLSASQWSRIYRLYGITQVEFDALLAGQGDRCPVCGRTFTARRFPCVDHDHATGLIRGLLCNVDNYGLLGTWGDDPGYYRRAADYLEGSPATAILGGPRFHRDAPPRPRSPRQRAPKDL